MAVSIDPRMDFGNSHAVHPFFQRSGPSRDLAPVKLSSSTPVNVADLPPRQGALTSSKFLDQRRESHDEIDVPRDARDEGHSQRYSNRVYLERQTGKPTSRKRRKLSPWAINTATSWFEPLVTEAAQPTTTLAQDLSTLRTIALDGVGDAAQSLASTPPASHWLSTEADPQIIPTLALGPRSPLPVEHQLSVTSRISVSGQEGEQHTHFGKAAKQRRSKRALQITGKGGLESSNTHETTTLPDVTGDLEPIRRNCRKRRNNGLVAILLYGTHDDGKRREIGHIIENIQGTEKLTQPAPKADPFMTQAINPYKPTHPFFTGKATRRKENDNVAATPFAPGSHLTACPLTSHPCRSFSTPGKMNHQAVVFRDSGVPQSRTDIVTPSVKTFRLPGTYEAAWPSANLAVAYPTPNDQEYAGLAPRGTTFQVFSGRRKLKDKSFLVDTAEDIILEISRKLIAPIQSGQINALHLSDSSKLIHLPERLVIAGQELRARSVAEVADLKSHPALCKMAANIEASQSCHGVSQFSAKQWAQKYAPNSAAETLQAGREMTVLRDWLEGLTVAAVESGTVQLTQGRLASRSTSIQPEYARRRKKRRKMSDELNDFVISSDEEEEAEMQQLSDPDDSLGFDYKPDARSIIRSSHMAENRGSQLQKKSNTVLLSGPHGSGKTAAAYAVARELGFEVFEINSGSRRSGKDVLDKVGDMARNHQVQKAPIKSHNGNTMDDNGLPGNPHCGEQSLLGSFFDIAIKQDRSKKRHPASRRREMQDQEKAPQHKQSLILLEEVDTLFDEDRSFWETVLELTIQSKRPIIMTCNDETCVPLDVLALQAILRFRPPPVGIATDYLLLLAAAEGHLLSRNAIATLYESNKYDLRASIMDLDFWCQMAVGEEKGGLEWYLKRWPPGADLDINGRILKVVSNGTFQIGMASFGQTQVVNGGCRSLSAEEDLLVDVWRNWGVDPWYASDDPLNTPLTKPYDDESRQQTPSDGYHLLKEFQTCLDDCSAMDVFAQVDLPGTSYREDLLDPTAPPMPEASLSAYVIEHPVLQADTLDDFEHFDTRITATMHLAIREYWVNQELIFKSSTGSCYTPTFVQNQLIHKINQQQLSTASHSHISRSDFATALDPLAHSIGPSNISLSGMHASSFDRNFSIVVEDLAPYVRSIVAFDQALEKQREQLNIMLSDGVRNGTTFRTTRASRSALEGSQRAKTRRERWFPKTLNLDLVMRTAGREWPQLGVGSLPQGASALPIVSSQASAQASRSASAERILPQ